MRAIVGLTLSGLGAFFVALALLLHFYITGQVSKFPLNELSEMTFTGHGISYFDFNQDLQMTSVDVQATQALQGDVEAGSSSTAVWVQFTKVQDLTNNQAVTSLSTSRRSAFDRRTGELINCCGDYVGTSTTVRQSGQGYRWPIGAQKRTYQVFDPTTLRPEPFQYEGSEPIDGKPAYQFAEHVSNQKYGTRMVPGWLVGATAAQVRVPEFITETDTVWVDPVSGIPLYEILSQTRTASYPDAVPLVLFQGTLVETPESAASTVEVASSFDLRRELLNEIGPLSGGLLGIVAIGAGVALAGRRKAVGQAALPEAPGSATHGHQAEIPDPGNAAGLPEAAYASRLPEGSRSPELLGNGHVPELSGAGYSLDPAESTQAWGYSTDSNGQSWLQPSYQEDQTQPLYLLSRPQPTYPRDRPQPADRPDRPQPGLTQSRPQPGPPQGRPQPHYRPEPDQTRYPPRRAETGQPTGQEPEPKLSPWFTGRKNDGIPRILEPGADQSRVDRDGRSGRDRAPGR